MSLVPLVRGSRARLTARHAEHFPDATLFHELARVVCSAECLPRKELFEAWEVARRVRRRVRGRFIVDVAGGHGLVAASLLLLDPSAPGALVVDPSAPLSYGRLRTVLTTRWPRLDAQLGYATEGVEQASLPAGSLLVGVHACGVLTDRLLDRAIAGRHPVAVLPCCHSAARCDDGGLTPWMPLATAVDATRAARLRQAGYSTHSALIPADITPENRLLVGIPTEGRPV